MPSRKDFTKQEILQAMRATRSVRAAARYLGCSYNHAKFWFKFYKDDATGKSLLEVHKNPSGKGISKFIPNKRKDSKLMDVLEGRISIDSYGVEKLKTRLLNEAYLKCECYQCGHFEKRVIDLKQPLLLNFKDNNKKNWKLDNLEMLCYNCFFLHIGDVFTSRQINHIEDWSIPRDTAKVDWDLKQKDIDAFLEANKNLDDSEDDDGDDLIAWNS